MKKSIFIITLLAIIGLQSIVSRAEEHGIKSKGNIQADNTAVSIAAEDIQYLHTEIRKLMSECGKE